MTGEATGLRRLVTDSRSEGIWAARVSAGAEILTIRRRDQETSRTLASHRGRNGVIPSQHPPAALVEVVDAWWAR